MSTKLFALVFILGLCVVTQGSSPDVDERVSLDQLLTEADEDVTKLKAFIDSAFTKAEEEASGIIKGAYAGFDKVVTQLLQHAGSAGATVSKCVDNLKSTVDDDSDALTRAVVQCVSSKADSALNDVQTLVDAAQSAERGIGSARAALKACDQIENLLKKAECVAKETANVAAQTASLTVKVSAAIADAYLIYKTFPTSVSKCEQEQLAAAALDAVALTAKVAKCSLS